MKIRFAAIAVCLTALALPVYAGSLNPTSAPAPTMHTLEEIYKQISGVSKQVETLREGLSSLLSDVAALQGDVLENRQLLSNIGADCYLVIDLSNGPAATNYPVSYLAAPPAAGWSDDYRTTKLALRRVPSGTFTMGSPSSEVGRVSNETQHQVTLTKDYYIGVFEVTQKQWERVMGTWPSWFTNAADRKIRPVENVSYFQVRENPSGFGVDDPSVNWPDSSAVNADSFMG